MLENGGSPGDAPLKKTALFFPSSSQLQIGIQLVIELCDQLATVIFFFFLWLELAHILGMLPKHCKFIGTVLKTHCMLKILFLYLNYFFLVVILRKIICTLKLKFKLCSPFLHFSFFLWLLLLKV